MKHILRGSVAASLWAVTVASPGLAQEASLPPAHLAGTRLDIIATGEVAVVPDMAIVGAGVVTQAENASAAMAENARRMAATTAAIRKAGIAYDDCEFDSELRCVAVPVRDFTGQVIGAIGISGPIWRLSLQVLQGRAKLVQAAADRLSADFGASAAARG